MFDVGFFELVLVFVIGLLILGPERLPRVAAQLGRWVGRARRTANQLRMQLEREIALEEQQRTQRQKRQTEPRDERRPPGDETVATEGRAPAAGGDARAETGAEAPLPDAAPGADAPRAEAPVGVPTQADSPAHEEETATR